ncbi:unnamed protein product, partial [Prorocentrum cordatum]
AMKDIYVAWFRRAVAAPLHAASLPARTSAGPIVPCHAHGLALRAVKSRGRQSSAVRGPHLPCRCCSGLAVHTDVSAAIVLESPKKVTSRAFWLDIGISLYWDPVAAAGTNDPRSRAIPYGTIQGSHCSAKTRADVAIASDSVRT